MTTSNIFLKDNNLYYINFNQKSLDPIQITSLTHKKRYNLIISDSYFFYISIEIPRKSKNTKNIIWNYLKAHFPEILVSNFGFIHIKSSVIVFIFNKKLQHFITANSHIFKKAKHISTPFLELCKKKDKFLYKVGQIVYEFNNGKIELCLTPESNIFDENDIVFNIHQLENDIEFSFLEKKVFNKKELIHFACIILLAYSIFIGGNIFRLKSINIIYNKLNNRINQLYQQAGVINSKDPYGLLLYKISKLNNKSDHYKISQILYDFSVACPKNCIITSISYQQNTILCYGHTSQLSGLDILRTKLQKYFSSVEIENTSKEQKQINFSLKCKLSK